MSIFEKLRCILYPTGLWVCVLGPDGVGKSSIIKELCKEVDSNMFRYSICFHFVPLLFKNHLKDSTPVTNPHSKRPWPFWISIIKILYIWISCWVFYFRDIFWRKRKGYLILSDRYYHDILVDPVRYRYAGPMFLVKLFAFLVPQPDLYIILDASEENILRRKNEISLEELSRQRLKYIELENNFPTRTRVVCAEGVVSEVVMRVKDTIFAFLEDRFLIFHSIGRRR